MIKTYRAVCLELCLSIKVNSSYERIVFGGGDFSKGEKGVYSSTSVSEQQSLEKHPLFNISFVLESTISEKQDAVNILKNKVVGKVPTPEDKVVGKVPTPEDKDSANVPIIFNSFKEFQNYLIKEHKCSFADVRSREGAISKAEELGITNYHIGE